MKAISKVPFIQRVDLSIICIIFALTVFLQIKYLNRDYGYQKVSTTSWHIHHDEKLIMPDARSMALNNKIHTEISDYEPSSMAAFGIAGPSLAAIGFKLFGLNNFGLRIFYLAISLIATLMLLFLIFSFDKGPLGFLFSVIYIISENNFVLQRHAIIENILSFYVLAIFFIYVYKNREFKKFFPYISFMGGSLLLFKINYLLYISLLMAVIMIVDSYDRQSIKKIAVYFIAGIIFFGLAQFFVLKSLGISGQFISNIRNGFMQHTGVPIKISETRIMEALPRAGISILFVLPSIFFDSYLSGLGEFAASAILLIIIGYFLSKESDDARYRMLKISVIFIAAFIIFSAFFYFYIKRMIFILPFLYLVFFAAVRQVYLRFFPVPGKLSKWLNAALFAAAFLLCVNYVIAKPMQLETGGSDLIYRNSKELNSFFPSGGKVFAHCYAYRFLWQAENVRFLSEDDQVYSNFYILEKAVKSKGEYVLLTSRWIVWGGDGDSVLAGWLKGMLSGEPIDLKKNRIVQQKPFIYDVLSKIKSIALLRSFNTTAMESDIEDTYLFCKIEYW